MAIKFLSSICSCANYWRIFRHASSNVILMERDEISIRNKYQLVIPQDSRESNLNRTFGEHIYIYIYSHGKFYRISTCTVVLESFANEG